MKKISTLILVFMVFLLIALIDSFSVFPVDNPSPVPKITIDSGHPWRPPFGLERIGSPVAVVVEFEALPPSHRYWLTGYRDGAEIARCPLDFRGQSPAVGRVSFEKWPNEVVLTQSDSDEKTTELTRQTLDIPAFEADAIAQSEPAINPIDLGTILPPDGWLLLRNGQQAHVDVAGISRDRDIPEAQLIAWYESAPQDKAVAAMPMVKDCRVTVTLPLPTAPSTGSNDTLLLAISEKDGVELWRKKIPAMLVQNAPQWPSFGATETKLRYDAPISIRNEDGSLSSMNYADAWDSRLNDVVVSLPNGSRYVFWRGSSYIPFWAGKYNTGLCFEWAESPPPQGFTDCVEPLMDKELRYGRVQIVESSNARVHVRWSYQSCDFHYKVWGDSAVEDYYFYPDGFGTRALTLRSGENATYELSEFILLTPAGTYPFQAIPSHLVDFLFVDGQKREIAFPFFPNEQGEKLQPRGMPVVYRIRLHKDEPLSAFYFNPQDTNLPNPFGPFTDRGSIVTPAYWGNHWPLARGRTTGNSIDSRFALTPAHNSLMTWGMEKRPLPVQSSVLNTLDILGQPRRMSVRQWVWFIGMSGAGDSELLEWAQSFSSPPEIQLRGARLDFDSYAPDRRAIRLIVEDAKLTITIIPKTRCVNPVFELIDAPQRLDRITLDDQPLQREDYAWDGRTLWIKANRDASATLQIHFGDTN